MPRPVSAGGRLSRALTEMEGGPAAYLSAGRGGGLPALLLHGFAGDLLTWQFNLSGLAADRRTIAVDLPGHGASTLDVGDGRIGSFAPWLLRLLDALEIPQVHVVGHSMGGYVGLELARQAPERVLSLSLIASAGLGSWFDVGFLHRLVRLESVEQGRHYAGRLFARPSVLVGRVGEVLHAQAADPARRAALEAIIEGSFARGPGAPVDWAALTAPVQLLWGREDHIIPVPPPELRPPDAPFHLFDNAGHLPHTEASSPLTAALRSFMSSCDPS
ncbi:alpha/beta fold hydrolase [Azospirillum thermophilum]|uniref:Alpha/beta hydrolase n=1 Tax=Azospirillum thermophilum TaxID=2202148 RepID=A0A2S2CLW5_9PROT|nr:alpha/beta fold hydrolase [Azospirillum thermophilum]AWK85494.1 alpha/beta hydrolase [Azospirillum thermophilum]